VDVTVTLTPGTYTTLSVNIAAHMYIDGEYKGATSSSDSSGSGYYSKTFSFWKG
jgi:hypothetical protein